MYPELIIVVMSATGAGILGCREGKTASVQRVSRARGLALEPKEVDFGFLEAASSAARELTSELTIQNCGAVPISLVRVDRGCSCFTANLDLPRQLRRGESLSIPVRVQIARLTTGPFSKALTLYTDEVVDNAYHVILRGTVVGRDAPSALPSVIDFGKFGDWETPERSVRLHHPAGAMQVVGVAGASVGLVCRINGTAANGSVTYSISVNNALPCGYFEERVHFDTNHGETDVTVRGTKLQDLVVSPGAMLFKSGASKSLEISCDPRNKVSELSVSSDIVDLVLLRWGAQAPGRIVADIQLAHGLREDFKKGILRVHARLNDASTVSASIPIYVDLRKDVGDRR